MSSGILQSQTHLHVVMFPFFAFGHINPFVQLSNRLSLHEVRVSFLSTRGIIERIKSSQLLNPKAQTIPLTIPSVKGLPTGLDSTAEMTPEMAEHLKTALDLMQPQIKSLLIELKPHFVFYDFSQYWIPKIGSEIGFKSLFFSTFPAISSAYIMAPARTKSGNDPTIEDLMKPPAGLSSASVKSMKMFQAQDFSYVFKHFDGGASVYERFHGCVNECSAIVMRTCTEMEATFVDYLKAQLQKPILLAGPLVDVPRSGVLDEKWANWLGQFPAKSVIFCCFGSENFLTNDQIKELALGLELTNSPFLLALNFPAGVDKQAQLDQALPAGFLKRVEGRAILHAGLVPQTSILASDRVGCLMTHMGYSSLIEGFATDCELVLLPMKGDQFLNTKLVAEDWNAGVEVNRRKEDGYFAKEDVYEAVKTVMIEGDKEPGQSIKPNRKKWSDFFSNHELHDKLVADMVKEMKAIA